MFHTIVPCPKGARPDQYARYFFESTQPVVGGILELDADRDSVCLTLTGTTFEVARLKLHGESLVEFKNRDRRKSDGAICLRRDVESMLIDIAARTDPPYLEFSGGSLAGSRAKLRKQ
jgi:hypothetical protein